MYEHLFAELYLQGFKTGIKIIQSQNSGRFETLQMCWWTFFNFEILLVKMVKKEK